jgi:hypothetical protein
LAASHRAEVKLSFLLFAEIEKASDVLGQLLGMLNKASIEAKVGRSHALPASKLPRNSLKYNFLGKCQNAVCARMAMLRLCRRLYEPSSNIQRRRVS